jgi:hypothetical protein
MHVLPFSHGSVVRALTTSPFSIPHRHGVIRCLTACTPYYCGSSYAETLFETIHALVGVASAPSSREVNPEATAAKMAETVATFVANVTLAYRRAVFATTPLAEALVRIFC